MKYEDFKKTVMNIPEWVKTDEDKLIYIRHLQYHLIKYESLMDWLNDLDDSINKMNMDKERLYEKLIKELNYSEETKIKMDPEIYTPFRIVMEGNE